jgi:hypothetical protein
MATQRICYMNLTWRGTLEKTDGYVLKVLGPTDLMGLPCLAIFHRQFFFR